MKHLTRSAAFAAGGSFGIVLFGASLSNALATVPCEDFDECKVLVEINATDGDIGFHWLGDAGDLRSLRIDDPNGAKIFESKVSGPLDEQKLTETFGESAEPLCWADLEADPEDLESTTTQRSRR